MNAPTMLDEALSLARAGWAVFPVRGKIPLPGSHGCLDATRDEATIRAWWTEHPEAGIAGATGAPSGRAVIDVDSYKPGADKALADLEAQHGALPLTVESVTGRGGRQLFFKSNGHSLPSVNGKLGIGLDFKADGGYVVLPPSTHPNGKAYAWNPAAHPSETSEAPLPEWVERSVTGGASVATSPTSTEANVSRHDALRSWTMRAAAKGLPEADIREAALGIATQNGMLAEGRGGEVEGLIVGALGKVKREGTEEPEEIPLPVPLSIYSPDVIPVRPEYTVKNFVRRVGMHLWWAQPSGGKTYFLLRMLHELMGERRASRLLDHPDLWIESEYRRVLWVATEETIGSLRHRADLIRVGLGPDYQINGEILYVSAVDSRRRVTLDDLPDYYAKHGPFDATVLDSLTGLRPKVVDGRRINWDLDNDSANILCLTLRAIVSEYQTALHLVHHSGRDVTRYRGATEYWASADAQIGLLPERDRVKVLPEKQRDGRVISPFYLKPTWSEAAFMLEYDGSASAVRLTPLALDVIEHVSKRGSASQAEIVRHFRKARATVQDAIRAAVDSGRLLDTGLKVNGSPIYRKVPEGAGDEAGTPEAE